MNTPCCVFVFLSTDLLCESWTYRGVCLCFYQLTCCAGHEHTELRVCVLFNWPAVWVMNTVCCVSLSNDLLRGSWTHCVMCPYQSTYCLGHEHTVLSVCVHINWPAVWVMNTLCCVSLLTDLLCGSWTHCVVCPYQMNCCVGHEHTVLCVLINWPAVWVMNTLCCVSLSTDLLCGSWTHCVVCPYQLTCCVGHEHTVLCFFSADR